MKPIAIASAIVAALALLVVMCSRPASSPPRNLRTVDAIAEALASLARRSTR